VARRVYLAGARRLADAPASAPPDRIGHDATTGSGRRSRWRTLVSPFVVADYPDRATRDRRLAVYRGEVLARALEIAGHPAVELFVAAEARDGAVFAYLEEETAGGAVHYITEGQLRLVHPCTAGPPLYASPAPYRSFRRGDARELVPGAVTAVVFDLLPVAYRFAPGSRIRLALATADADHFVPIAGAGALRIERSLAHPSSLVLPVIS
jgi:uncharacterized protein